MSAGWNTIESDAGVFTYLIDNLGVKDVQFEELISLEPSELQQLSPVYGVIFLFKYPTGEAQGSSAGSSNNQPRDGTYDHDAAQNIFFANQVIQNACGTQALLSVLLNKDSELDIGPKLSEFKDFTLAFPPDLRGEALSNSELIRDVHNSFARSSPFVDETQRLATEDDDVYHFIAYTCLNGTLYEIDGLQPAPISHGSCSPSDFPEHVIPVLQRRIARYPAHEIRFNLLAMVRDLRIQAKSLGDAEGLRREEKKREGWKWENALRRHNFIGFIDELLKAVVREKVGHGETGSGIGGEVARANDAYDTWIKDAKERTRKRVEEGRKKGLSAEDQ